jgi:hypothetical protein
MADNIFSYGKTKANTVANAVINAPKSAIDSIKNKVDNVKDFANKTLVDDPIKFLFGDMGSQNLDINIYKSKFLGANARSYLFICKVQFPGFQNVLGSGIQSALAGGNAAEGLMAAATTGIQTSGTLTGTENFKYYVKASSLPESTVEEVSTFWAGQQYKMSSVRRSQDWTVTFLVNNDASLIRKFWEWHLIMHNPESNMYGSPKDYMADQVIQLLGIDGYPICTYKLFGAWPKSIGQVDLDYSSNEFAEVAITFAYQYHTVTESEEAGGMSLARKMGMNAVRSML